MTMQLKKPLLIFDFDGTLIDSVPDLADAINDMLITLSKAPHSIDDIRHWVGNGSRLLVERALVGDTIVPEGQLDKDETDRAEAIYFESYANIVNDKSKTIAYPYVDEGLKKLKDAGFILALVTNKPMRYVPKLLQAFGWQDMFVKVLGGDSLPMKKPDPMPLQHVCAELGMTTDKAVMIGDSKNDILAGQNANMATLGVSYGYNYGQHISIYNPTQVFDDFASLTDWIITHYTHAKDEHAKG